ncbi:hypothetical protein ACJX0J_010013 [Zea mays]
MLRLIEDVVVYVISMQHTSDCKHHHVEAHVEAWLISVNQQLSANNHGKKTLRCHYYKEICAIKLRNIIWIIFRYMTDKTIVREEKRMTSKATEGSTYHFFKIAYLQRSCKAVKFYLDAVIEAGLSVTEAYLKHMDALDHFQSITHNGKMEPNQMDICGLDIAINSYLAERKNRKLKRLGWTSHFFWLMRELPHDVKKGVMNQVIVNDFSYNGHLDPIKVYKSG